MFDNLSQRLARCETVGEAGAHHTGKNGDKHAFFKIEFLDGGRLFFLGKFLLLGHASRAADCDANETGQHACKNCEAGTAGEQFAEFAIKDRRHKRAKGGTETKSDSHAESDPEIAHGETKSEAADAPEDAEEVGPHQRRARCGDSWQGS